MTKVSIPDSSGRIQELDGWRAISVLLVIVSHLLSFRNLVQLNPAISRVVYLAGNLGVTVFFVISGFVICRLFILEEKKFGSVSLKGFYCRRAFRILPPLYIFLAAIALLLAAGLIRGRWEALPVAAAFLSDLDKIPKNWFVEHTWSLAVEEQFYLIFPAMWVLTPSRWRARVAAATFLLCIVSSLAATVPQFTFLFGTAPRWGFAAITVGVWAAIQEGWVRQTAARAPGVLVALVALILLVRPVREVNSREMALFCAAFMPLAIGLVLMYSLERGRWLRAVLCSRPMQAIGLTSYGIYLWQQVFTGDLNKFTSRGVAIGFMLPLMLIIVPLSYFFLEKPAMRFGRALSRRARETAAVRSGNAT
jgi:peptidoglycan/LPS O-acetylase OafA/YrhL